MLIAVKEGIMKKFLTVLFMLIAVQTAVYADAETDMHQVYIAKIQAQDINTIHLIFSMQLTAVIHNL